MARLGDATWHHKSVTLDIEPCGDDVIKRI